jgi:hypothetical protein
MTITTSNSTNVNPRLVRIDLVSVGVKLCLNVHHEVDLVEYEPDGRRATESHQVAVPHHPQHEQDAEGVHR